MSKKKKYPVAHDGGVKKTAGKMTFIEFGDPEPVAAWGCYYGSLWDG
ncbi:phage portal protein, partial [Salmonella enterica subsp. enterica serovar Brandenburg]